MVLVLMGCGSAVFAGSAAGAGSAGVGLLGVAFAYGLLGGGLVGGIGGISDCIINPSISLGVMFAGRGCVHEAAMSMLVRVRGAVCGSCAFPIILYI